jgi:hypothetical protein
MDINDKSATLHTHGSDHWSYWTRFIQGIKLIFGARIHYRFCNGIEPVIGTTNKFLGFKHVKSTGLLIISRKSPSLA